MCMSAARPRRSVPCAFYRRLVKGNNYVWKWALTPRLPRTICFAFGVVWRAPGVRRVACRRRSRVLRRQRCEAVHTPLRRRHSAPTAPRTAAARAGRAPCQGGRGARAYCAGYARRHERRRRPRDCHRVGRWGWGNHASAKGALPVVPPPHSGPTTPGEFRNCHVIGLYLDAARRSVDLLH